MNVRAYRFLDNRFAIRYSDMSTLIRSYPVAMFENSRSKVAVHQTCTGSMNDDGQRRESVNP